MVNVFIIKPNIYETARLLDRQRLCKQRLETKQIIDSLEEYDATGTITKSGWSNHPAVKSWIGFTNHLKVYFNIIVREWCNRGYKNTMQLYPIDERPYNIVMCNFNGISAEYDKNSFNQYSFPFWISFPPFYLSHQASLCRKNPKHYKNLLCPELNQYLNNGYLWPCNVNSTCYTNWNFSHHEILGDGTPSVYKLDIIDILKWLINPLINPSSSRTITEKSAIYKSYEDAMKGHKITIVNSYIYIDIIQLCNLQNINLGIMYIEQYYSSIGGKPNPLQLVYKFAN